MQKTMGVVTSVILSAFAAYALSLIHIYVYKRQGLFTLPVAQRPSIARPLAVVMPTKTKLPKKPYLTMKPKK